MRLIKSKKCKECGADFTPSKSTIPVCSYQCAIKRTKDLNWKKEKKIMKDKLKTRTSYMLELQTATNELIRMIDFEQPCISCGCYPKKPHAGHYHSVKSNNTLRYHLFNIWLQCYKCNDRLSGNIIEYNKGLRTEYSNELQIYIEQYLVCQFQLLKLTKDDLIKFLAITRKAIRQIGKEKRTKEQRLELRKYYMDYIGIYK